MRYRADIDGLRAVAVLPVIMFHAGLSAFSGGYIGVDVFFVISGYLITTILLGDLTKGRFSILKFYERRARRILPALFFVIRCCLPPALLWMYPAQLANFGMTVAAVVLFASNILFWRKLDYFASDAEFNPLLHTWSLAIEEQYYIFFPLLLALLWRLGRRAPIVGITVLALGSLALASLNWPRANFYLLPTRAWELLAGSIAAWLHWRGLAQGAGPGAVRLAPALSWFGLVLIAYSMLTYDGNTRFPSVLALVPVLGTVLVVLFGAAPQGAGRILSLRPMVGVGLVSYSAYLWHQPLFAFARIRSVNEPSVPLMLGLAALSLALAAFTWRFVEQPFRRRPVPVFARRSSVFTASALGGAGLLAMAGVLYLGQGLPGRMAPSGVRFAELDIGARIAAVRSEISNCAEADCPPQTVLLWGDSFAMHLRPALVAGLPDEEALALFGRPFCAPMLGVALTNAAYPARWSRDCTAFNDSVMEWLRNHPDIHTVVLSSPLWLLGHGVHLRDGTVLTDPMEVRAAVGAALLKTADEVRATGRRLVFVSPPAQNGLNLSACPIRRLIFGGQSEEDCTFAATERSASNQAALALLAEIEVELPVLWLDRLLCDGGRCRTRLGNTILYRDTGHFSHEGSRMLGIQFDLMSRVAETAK